MTICTCRISKIGLLLSFYLLQASLLFAQPAQEKPAALREFRAAWVATVANINWPSKPGLPTETQQQEAIALLDFLQQHHFNAVVFQVRPQADALYKSDLEPWSYYLSGTQGKAPSPFYDPLTFWVEEAHKRGIELHVWLNPYRAHHKDGGPISEQSIVKTKPELSLFLKEGYWWLDPAAKGTQDHSYSVAMDLVNRYDIDGLHFDDYFYPYPSYNLGEDFPDDKSWKAYQQQGGKLSRGDWRRDAVNTFIERLYKGIKAAKPNVKFGLSPFGIWRPGYPAQIEGFDQYDQLYADAKLWLNKGWIDYFAPQLYWPINKIPQSYPVLLGWWESENTLGRHLWPGISVGRDTGLANTREINNEILVARGIVPKSMGVIHWSIGQLIRNPALSKSLKEGVYQQQALVPASPWLGSTPPARPAGLTFSRNGESIKLTWNKQNDASQYVLYYRFDGKWQYKILTSFENGATLPAGRTLKEFNEPISKVMLSAVSKTGIESEMSEFW